MLGRRERAVDVRIPPLSSPWRPLLPVAFLLLVFAGATGSRGAEPVQEPAGAAPSDPAPLLTLEGAIAIASQSNLELARADDRSEAAAARAKEVHGFRFPQISLEAGFVRTDNPVLVFGQKLLQGRFMASDFDLDSLNNPAAWNDWSARLVLEQSLWSGGKLAGGSDAARSAADASIADRERARQELVRTVIDHYTAVLLADYGRKAALESLETAGANVELVEDLYDTGMVVESDLLLAQVRESEVAELVVRAEAASEIARAALNLTLGRDQGTVFRMPETLVELEGAAPGGVAELVGRAFEQRPDLAAARDHVAASQSQLRVAKGGLRPDVGLQASVETHAEDFFGNDGDNATVGVGLRLPLFSGKSDRARIARAEAQLSEVNHQTEQLRQQVELEVRSRLADLGAAEKRLALSLRGMDLAQRSLSIVEDRYRNGLTTLVDLLESESALTQSRVREVSARRDVVLARAGLDLATGDL